MEFSLEERLFFLTAFGILVILMMKLWSYYRPGPAASKVIGSVLACTNGITQYVAKRRLFQHVIIGVVLGLVTGELIAFAIGGTAMPHEFDLRGLTMVFAVLGMLILGPVTGFFAGLLSAISGPWCVRVLVSTAMITILSALVVPFMTLEEQVSQNFEWALAHLLPIATIVSLATPIVDRALLKSIRNW